MNEDYKYKVEIELVLPKDLIRYNLCLSKSAQVSFRKSI